MRSKLLICALVGSLVALAAWCVDRGGSAAAHPENEAGPSAQNAEPQSTNIPAKYHDTIRKGLEYLAKNQRPDGHWEGDDGKHPVAMTGLVGLALLMDRKAAKPGYALGTKGASTRYLAQISKAADWLMDQSKPRRDGLIYSEHASETTRYMEGHGLATLFLAGVCQDETDAVRRKKLTKVLTRAVKYIDKAQSSQGGWYHTSKVEGHDFAVILATVMQIQALVAAENAGIVVPRDSINGGLQYLEGAIADQEQNGPAQNASRLVDIAAALACRSSEAGSNIRVIDLDKKEKDGNEAWCKKCLQYCQTELAVGQNASLGRDGLAQYYFAQALFNVGDDTWSRYRTAMFDQLQRRQNKDGSWPASDGVSVGPVYATALWCTVLQLDNKSHPARIEIPTLVK